MSQSNRVKKDVEKLLGITAKPPAIPDGNKVPARQHAEDERFQKDFEEARRNILNLIEDGTSIFEIAKDYAENAQSTRSFEVANQLLKTLFEGNKSLLNVHEIRKNVNKKDDASGPMTINAEKVAFVGTTADLQKKLRE